MKKGILSIAMLLFLAIASAQAQDGLHRHAHAHMHKAKVDKKQLVMFSKYESSFTKADSRKHAKQLKEKMRQARINSKVQEGRAKRKNIMAKREVKKRGLQSHKERPLLSVR